ncbi:hypothetical protein Tco_0407068 [Tanacetum coccineum]
MSVEKDWATIKELAQYEDKGWNDPILPDERSIDHKNPNIEQLLGIMENYVDMLMKDAISIIRRSENVFGISSDMMRQLPPELPPLVRESTFGFKSGTKNNRNVKSRHDVENSNPQVLPSFEVYTPPVTYPEEVEETLGTPMEVEPLNETPLEDLGLNTCNHDIPLSSREIPSFDKPEPQPQPFSNFPSLDVILGDKRGPKPPIKSQSG